MALVVTVTIAAALAGIAAILALALRRDNGAAVVNAAVSLAAALLPISLAASLDTWLGITVQVPAALTLWIAVAGLLHSVGMLGPYDTVWWYDHLTHFVSAALVAALLYGAVLAVGQAPGGVAVGRATSAGLAVGLTMLAGLCWELIELVAREVGERIDVEPVLVHYGWRDTAFDLVFDLLGALVVVLLDVRAFVTLAEESVRVTRLLLMTTSGLVLVGSVAMAAIVWVGPGAKKG
jgi:hypothetical protein